MAPTSRVADLYRKAAGFQVGARSGILAVVALALLVRIPIAAGTRHLGTPIEDEQHYVALATSLVSGHGLAWGPEMPTSIRPPLYPFFIATVWSVAGSHSLEAVRWAQALLGVLSVALLFLIGRQWFGERAGFGAAAAFAIYPSMLFSGALLLTETLFTTLLLAMVYAFARFERAPSHRLSVAMGLALGLAALTRSVLWPFVIVLAGAAWFVAAGLPRRTRVTMAVAVVLGFAAVVGPWSARNSALQGTFTVVDTLGGLNLMMGNYAYTPENRMWDAVGMTGEKAWYHQLPSTAPDGGRWTEGKKEKWAQRQALAFIASHPLITLRRAALKFADFWGLERDFIAGIQRGYYHPPAWLAVAGAASMTLAFVATAVLAAIGLCLAPPPRNVHLMLLAILLTVCGLHTLVFGHSRYHLPLVPLLLLYASAAWTSGAWRAIGRGRLVSVTAAALVVMLLVIWSREVFVRDWDKLRGLLGGGA